MKKKNIFRYIALGILGGVLIICSLSLIEFYNLDGASLEMGKKAGEPIVQALEQFRLDYGYYPSELDPLVPKYLASIPQPAWRSLFYYDVCDSNHDYVLSFLRSNDADTYWGYVRSKGKWVISDSYPPRCGIESN